MERAESQHRENKVLAMFWVLKAQRTCFDRKYCFSLFLFNYVVSSILQIAAITRHVSCLFEQIRILFFAVALNTNKNILPFHT